MKVSGEVTLPYWLQFFEDHNDDGSTGHDDGGWHGGGDSDDGTDRKYGMYGTQGN